MALFQIVSKLDGKTYDVVWDASSPVLRVIQPAAPSVPPPGYGAPPPAPSFGFCQNLNIDNVGAFEEGRLSREGETNPYSKSDNAASWAFGVLCK